MPRIPDDVVRFFDGNDLERKVGLAAYLVTTGQDGWSHAAMVSPGEVLVEGDGAARLGLWPTSRTTANVRHTGRAVLLVILEHQPFRIRLSLRETAEPSASTSLVCFVGTVVDVVRDVADYAVVDHGVTFTLKDPTETVQRWKDTVSALRRLER